MSNNTNDQNEPTANSIAALLGAGLLPEVADGILAEAARRWSVEPYASYSDQAQRVKMDKAAAKRARRAAKHSVKDMDNEASSDFGDELAAMFGLRNRR